MIRAVLLAAAIAASASPAIAGERALQPTGFVSFCTRFPDQCKIDRDAPTTVRSTPSLFALLEEINETFNRAIKPMDDQRHYGKAEYWTIPADGFGDCEDYALAKRAALNKAGLPLAALRVAIVLTAEGERHAVLDVVTDRGDLVLDNLRDAIRPIAETGYRLVERQSPTEGWGWETS